MFHKTAAGKKTNISGIMRLGSFGNELGSFVLPPLTETPPSIVDKTKPQRESAYVPCFSNPIDDDDDQRIQGGIFDSFSNSTLPRTPLSTGGNSSFFSAQGVQAPSNLPSPGSVYSIQDQTILTALLDNHGSYLRNSFNFKPEEDQTDVNTEFSSSVVTNQQYPPAPAAAPMDLGSLWGY